MWQGEKCCKNDGDKTVISSRAITCLQKADRVRILAPRPNGKSGGGVDRSSLPSLAPEFTPVESSQDELCKDAWSEENGMKRLYRPLPESFARPSCASLVSDKKQER